MTLQKIPRDTVVGTVGDYVNIEREESVHPDERLANMYFEITTFGDPVVIEVEYTWRPEETEDPEIKTGMVVRIGGWLAEPGPELNPELGYGDKDGMEMETWEVEGDREVSVLVCGGRNFNGWTAMQRALDRISPDIIIHGAAGGADSMAGRYAQENNIPCRDFPAEWRRYGKSAGYRRNQQMLDEGKPDLVVAFPGGRGTQNMVEISRQQGFEVNIIDHQGNPRHGGNTPVVEG